MNGKKQVLRGLNVVALYQVHMTLNQGGNASHAFLQKNLHPETICPFEIPNTPYSQGLGGFRDDDQGIDKWCDELIKCEK